MTARRILLACCLSLVALAAAAQTAAPRLRTVEPAPAAVAPGAVVDKDAQIEQLREGNRRLRAENNELKARIDAMTSRGGGAVTAYCESAHESRNTAGAAEACGVYTCNETSGLCRDRCTSSNHCRSDTRCNVASGVCESAGG